METAQRRWGAPATGGRGDGGKGGSKNNCMKVKLKSSLADRPSRLIFEKSYEVLGIEADWYRILNEKSDPVLYPSELFDLIDDSEPADWLTEHGQDGERYSYPPELSGVGFFEDYHDNKLDAVAAFQEYLNRRQL
jgi:hypothetical protein